MPARQEENHWQSCWTDGKSDRNINVKLTIMKLKCRKWRHNVKSFEVKKGHFIKSHKWKQIIAIVTPFICIFGKTFEFWSFSSFLFIDLANFNCPFILSVKYWKYSSLIPLSALRHSKPQTAHAEWRESLDPSCMITEYQMFTDVWQEFHRNRSHVRKRLTTMKKQDLLITNQIRESCYSYDYHLYRIFFGSSRLSSRCEQVAVGWFV